MLSTPITSDAPISRAPAVAQSPIGPWAKTATVWPIATSARLGGRDAGRGDVGEQHALLVAEVVGDLRQVGLGVGNAEVVGLDAVDRVAEAPAADHLPVVLVARALRLGVGLAEEAGAARRDRADQHPVADLVARDGVAELVDDADRLVADDPPRLDRVLLAPDVDVGAADRRQRDLDDRVVGAAAGHRMLLEGDPLAALERRPRASSRRRVGSPSGWGLGRHGLLGHLSALAGWQGVRASSP